MTYGVDESKSVYRSLLFNPVRDYLDGLEHATRQKLAELDREQRPSKRVMRHAERILALVLEVRDARTKEDTIIAAIALGGMIKQIRAQVKGVEGVKIRDSGRRRRTRADPAELWIEFSRIRSKNPYLGNVEAAQLAGRKFGYSRHSKQPYELLKPHIKALSDEVS